jgi:hypothetical protein
MFFLADLYFAILAKADLYFALLADLYFVGYNQGSTFQFCIFLSHLAESR